jgi:chemotaxis protein methyltransferase WspC
VKRIEKLLSREIGLNAASIGSSAVEAAVKIRLRACGALEISEYLARLHSDPSERTALVEEIVVSETWFFRDEEVFKTLRRHAAAWLGREKPLRVLSLPCATGEEAYSVSIALLEAGLRAHRFSVRGIDVSDRVLAHARRGEYGKNSFRGVEARARAGYFEATGKAWRVVDAAREPVTFARGNVLDGTLFAARSFDVVLCRNLLIYLDPPARARALENLGAWLGDDGLLFAGHAEAIELIDARFQRLAESTPFAYVKKGRERPDGVRPGVSTGRLPLPTRPVAVASSSNSHRKKPEAKPATATDTGARPLVASLERATELANRGRLEDAKQVCERFIADAGASPGAYCLLGIISTAAGQRDDAIACFNKSLYLDQNHHEALVHLALLHEQRGEPSVAANFRRRAERSRRGEVK